MRDIRKQKRQELKEEVNDALQEITGCNWSPSLKLPRVDNNKHKKERKDNERRSANSEHVKK
jgi:hypothetical protein